MVDLQTDYAQEAPRRAVDVGTPIDLQRLGAVVWRARYLLVAVALVTGALGVFVAKRFVPVTYSATAALVWEPEEQLADATEHERKLRTIVESVKLPRNLEQVRERRGAAMALEQLARRLKVAVRPDSSLIQVTGEADDPVAAKQLADETAAVLIEHQTELRIQELTEREQRLSALLELAREEASKARADYDEFRAEYGIIYLPSDRDLLVEQVRTYERAADLARVDADSHQTRARELTRATAALAEPVVLSEHELDAGKKRQAEIAAELEGLRGALSDQHPKVLALQAQLDSITHAGDDIAPVVDARVVGRHPQLDTIEQGAKTATADQAAAATRHERLVELEGHANARLERLNKIEGRARELFAGVTRTEERVSHFEQALAQVRDELSAPTVGLSLLSPASVPTFPSSSKRRVVALGIPAGSLALAVLLLLALSNRGLRGHSAREIAYWARLPVIASTRWPVSPSEHDRPADVLRSVLGEQRDVLLVPLAPDLGNHADELAAMMRESAVSNQDARDDRVSPSETSIAVERTTEVALLRRRVRDSGRVLVLAQSGRHSLLELRALRGLIGRDAGVAIVLVGVGSHLAPLAERAGDIEQFSCPSPLAPKA